MFNNNNMITEGGAQKWSNIIKEELNINDPSKLSWMSQYAQNHEIYEGLQVGTSGVNAYPLNTLGMGNPMMPTGVGFNGPDGAGNGTGIGNTGSDFHNTNYGVGSGDLPMSTLTMALQVAATTIGFELVPVIPANGPFQMISYMDFPYAGGKLGKINETSFDGKGKGDENKPIFVKFNVADIKYAGGKSKNDLIPMSTYVTVKSDSACLVGRFIGFSRIDNDMIIKVVGCADSASNAGKISTLSANVSIADVFKAKPTTVEFGTLSGDAISADTSVVTSATLSNARVDLVAAAADHVQGFSNFFSGDDDPMTRAQNETGVGNTIGARLFSKLIQMGSFEVTGSVTRQQLQDMPLYGQDVVGKVLEAMQNELSQAINNRILDRVFKLGVTNAKLQKQYQGIDLNLFFGTPGATTKDLKDFSGASKFIDIHNENAAKDWGVIHSATQNTSAENFSTHQRRIMSRILAAANVITNVSRWGRPNWVVTNTQVLTAIQDTAGFVIAPMTNTLTQDGSNNLYFAGSVAGLNVYVDPYMAWDDTRVCVGRKSNGSNPGVIFMPYILADKVQVTAEGTMAPKLLLNSRFAIVDAGFQPEHNYFTFMVDSSNESIII